MLSFASADRVLFSLQFEFERMSNRETLLALSREMLSDPDVAAKVPEDVRNAEWLGFPGCSDEQIAAAEKRLGVSFPPSLRQFYAITNGWRDLNSFVYSILPIEKIGYLDVVAPGVAEIVNSLATMEENDPDYFEKEITRVLRSIVLSTEGDASTTLIDPQSDVGSGEWEVGRWASWHPEMEWSNMDWWAYIAEQGPTEPF